MRKYLFIVYYGTFKYTLCLKCREFGVKPDGTYGKHYAGKSLVF